jgi:formate dehydrogenase
MARVLCVLYDDPIDGHPTEYAREDIPKLEEYPDGQAMPKPSNIDFTPGELLGDVSGELGLRKFLEDNGHELIVTSDKDGEDSEFERELPEAEIVISQPFWPAYLDAKRLEKAKKLKLAITAGVGSDHVDMDAAEKHGVKVVEVTQSNSISVAEHVVMLILSLVRNFVPSHQWAVEGGWNIADCVKRAYDLEGMKVGTLALGRIGFAVLKRLKPFDVELYYNSHHRRSEELEKEHGLTWCENMEELARNCDVITLNAPLTKETRHIVDAEMISKMKRGTYLINTARAELCDRDAVVEALESGHLAGYAGDVWYPQPPAEDHPWRTMPHNNMTPHVSGSTLPGQARYAAGVREILEAYFAGQPIREEYVKVGDP